MTGFNKLLLAVLLGAVAYSAREAYRERRLAAPVDYGKPYVVVYGRDDCGYCRALQKGLDRRGIPYAWRRVDEEPVMQDLIPRMTRAGLDTGYFNLPVVDVNSRVMIRPETDLVASIYSGGKP